MEKKKSEQSPGTYGTKISNKSVIVDMDEKIKF